MKNHALLLSILVTVLIIFILGVLAYHYKSKFLLYLLPVAAAIEIIFYAIKKPRSQ